MRAVTVLRRDDGSTTLTCTGMETSDASAIVELLHEGLSLVTTIIPTGVTNHTNRTQEES